jgi:hypothetical protein
MGCTPCKEETDMSLEPPFVTPNKRNIVTLKGVRRVESPGNSFAVT